MITNKILSAGSFLAPNRGRIYLGFLASESTKVFSGPFYDRNKVGKCYGWKIWKEIAKYLSNFEIFSSFFNEICDK